MCALVKGRVYPLPAPCRLAAMMALSGADVGHPVVSAVFEWLRAASRVQHSLNGRGGFLYFDADVRAGESAVPLELWEGLLLMPFVPTGQWEPGMSFSERVELRNCCDQIRANLCFVDAAPLRCQARLLLALVEEAKPYLSAARRLGAWCQEHRVAKLPVLMPILSSQSATAGAGGLG